MILRAPMNPEYVTEFGYLSTTKSVALTYLYVLTFLMKHAINILYELQKDIQPCFSTMK